MKEHAMRSVPCDRPSRQDPLEFLTALLAYGTRPPIPEALRPVASLLAGLGYTSLAIDAAVRDLAARGTAEESPWVDEADRAAVEELLPRDPEWAALEWDRYVYATIDGAATAEAV